MFSSLLMIGLKSSNELSFKGNLFQVPPAPNLDAQPRLIHKKWIFYWKLQRCFVNKFLKYFTIIFFCFEDSLPNLHFSLDSVAWQFEWTFFTEISLCCFHSLNLYIFFSILFLQNENFKMMADFFSSNV